MWRFIWLLIILIVSVWVGLQIAKDPGVAYFSYRQWSMEMPLWFAILSLIILMVSLYCILRLFGSVDSTFYRWKNWLQWRRKHKAYSKTNRGLIELLEAHWKSAEYYLLEGLPQSDAPLINYLALAKAAHEQGAFDRREAYLRNAYAAAPQADVAIGVTQAQLQLNQGQLEQALATLGHLRSVAPQHNFVLKLLERVYIHLGDWKNLLKLLPSLYKAKITTRENLSLLEKNIYEELLKSSGNLVSLQETWKNLPRKLHKDPQIIYCYVKQFASYPEVSEDIEELVYKSLKKTWDKDLVKLYGDLMTANPKKQLAHGEILLKRYPNQAVLMATLGRLCLRCQLWGKARSYFEESLNLEENPATYVEYGKLLEQLGDSNIAMQNYRDGLLLCSGIPVIPANVGNKSDSKKFF